MAEEGPFVLAVVVLARHGERTEALDRHTLMRPGAVQGVGDAVRQADVARRGAGNDAREGDPGIGGPGEEVGTREARELRGGGGVHDCAGERGEAAALAGEEHAGEAAGVMQKPRGGGAELKGYSGLQQGRVQRGLDGERTRRRPLEELVEKRVRRHLAGVGALEAARGADILAEVGFGRDHEDAQALRGRGERGGDAARGTAGDDNVEGSVDGDARGCGGGVHGLCPVRISVLHLVVVRAGNHTWETYQKAPHGASRGAVLCW